MRFRMLGPLLVWDGTGFAAIRAAQQRVVLAVLLTEAGNTVSAERLVEEIWGAHPPRTAVNTIQGYVMRLRKMLGSDPGVRLLTQGRGYRLLVADEQVDARVFEQLADSGRRNLAGGQLASGVEQLAAGLALWRGPALDDVPSSPAVAAEAARLEQRRLTALEARLGAELDLGRHAGTVDELQRLVGTHPLREGLRAHLMLALYRCGRRAEALEVYRRGRATLIAELGMEPGPELRDLERAILADDQRLAAATGASAGSRVVPAQLPADVAGFTGRDTHLRRLDDLISDPNGMVILAISGAAGVGKTALAMHWAHRVRDRFGDGQLYVNLRGNAPGPPLPPVEALARFLHALGVHAEQVPTDVDEAAALYRSLLADRRMLVVLDNADHPDQVRPLLPGAPGCAVLVTSRAVPAGLIARDGAHSLTLDVLVPEEAHALLENLLGAERTHAEPRQAAELAGLCACLPLALRIAAAHLIAQPHSPIADYTKRLRTGNRLTALQVDGDDQAAVRAAFDLSYAALPADTRRLFRLLGSVPGPEVTSGSAAALAGITPEEAEEQLTRLASSHLIDRHGPGRRYGFHDLLRLYANERGEHEDGAQERDAASQRLYEWYLRTVDAAAMVLYPQMLRLSLPSAHTQEPSTVFGDHAEALAWLDAERPNLVAAITYSAQRRPRPVAGRLAESLRGYFWLRMYTVDWLAVATAGLSIAETGDDLRAQTVALLSLADVHYRQGHYGPAIEYSTRALATARDAGWQDGKAAAFGYLGNLHMESGRLAEAADHHRRALGINKRTGRLTSQVNNIGNLGIVYWHLGDLSEALTQFTQALAINRKLESSHGEAVNLGNLAGVWHELGRFDDALDHLGQALKLRRAVGDRGAEADTRTTLAAVHCDAGRYPLALEHAHAALTLARDAGDRHTEADTLNVLGTIHQRLGHHADAVDHHQQAIGLAGDTSYRYGETKALIGLATARRNPEDADRAIELAGKAGYRVLDAQARTVLAAIRLGQNRVGEATELAERALAMHRETGHRLGEAWALLVLGRAGKHDRAEALALFADIGAPWADHVGVLFHEATPA